MDDHSLTSNPNGRPDEEGTDQSQGSQFIADLYISEGGVYSLVLLCFSIWQQLSFITDNFAPVL